MNIRTIAKAKKRVSLLKYWLNKGGWGYRPSSFTYRSAKIGIGTKSNIGYGRDSGGTIEVKNFGGTWTLIDSLKR